MIDFEIEFKSPPSGLNYVSKVLYSGTSVFSEFSKKKTKKRYIQNRNVVYKTSLLLFLILIKLTTFSWYFINSILMTTSFKF